MRRRIFVFGSNLMGYHGGGAAAYAAAECGAERGVGEGLTGDSYALPTCAAPGLALGELEIRNACERFRDFAISRPDLDFLLTAVGCGIAGYEPRDIISFFDGDGEGARLPDNVYLQARLAYGFEDFFAESLED